MTWEKSCGAVLYTQENGETRYVLTRNYKGFTPAERAQALPVALYPPRWMAAAAPRPLRGCRALHRLPPVP